MTIGREVKLFVSSIILIALGVVLVVQYTDVCRLQAVTLNGQPVESWDHQLGLRSDVPVIRQPIDSLANAILSRQGITHVDIQYRLPSMLLISTNNLDPVCYMIDRTTGLFFGLDESGRVVPVDISQSKWDLPIFTGLRVRRLHDYPDDYRVSVVLPQILQIRQSNKVLFEFIEEVDFTHPNYVGLGLAGRGFSLRLPADQIVERLGEFNTFVSRYHPPLDSTSCFDMSYDDVIIRVGAVPKKKQTVVDSDIVNDKSDFSDETDLEPVTQMDLPAKTTGDGTETQPTSGSTDVSSSSESDLAARKVVTGTKTNGQSTESTKKLANVRNQSAPTGTGKTAAFKGDKARSKVSSTPTAVAKKVHNPGAKSIKKQNAPVGAKSRTGVSHSVKSSTGSASKTPAVPGTKSPKATRP